MEGKFIVFDGADCLGKTTQIDIIFHHLLEQGYKVVMTRNPGGTSTGNKIREVLLNNDKPINSKAQLLLFLADRALHYDEFIKPHLDEGYIILCDRYLLSTLVYQHKLCDISEHLINDLNGYVTNYLKPDATFVFTGKRLTSDLRDNYEKELGNNFHEKLNNYYYDYAMELDNHIIIDANRDSNTVYNDILNNLNNIIGGI